MTTKKYTAGWWKLLFWIWLAVFIAGTIAYVMGANSIRTKTGNTITIDRSADYSLYKVNDTAAFYLKSKSPENVSLVKYEAAFPLFRIFGDHEYEREILSSGLAVQSDWIYIKDPAYYDKGRVIGYNIKNGQTIIKQTDKTEVPGQAVPEFLSHGIISDGETALTPDYVLKNFTRLSVPKESAIIFFSGFIAVGILLLLIWPFARKKVVQ